MLYTCPVGWRCVQVCPWHEADGAQTPQVECDTPGCPELTEVSDGMERLRVGRGRTAGGRRRDRTGRGAGRGSGSGMDGMRALASLSLVTSRGLETAELGPRILADSFGSQLARLAKSADNIALQDWT